MCEMNNAGKINHRETNIALCGSERSDFLGLPEHRCLNCFHRERKKLRTYVQPLYALISRI